MEDERAAHKVQIEKYNFSLTALSSKVQMLVHINENIGRDLEYLRFEYQNYRTIVWSVYQEVKRHLDNLRVQDIEIQNYLEKPHSSDAEKFNFFNECYHQLRRETVYIDYLLAERRSLI